MGSRDELVTRVLERATSLLEKGWCQTSAARDKDGFRVSALSEDAACFCMTGSIQRAVSDEIPHGVAEIRRRAEQFVRKTLYESVENWNDRPSRTKEQVVEKMKQATELSKNVS